MIKVGVIFGGESVEHEVSIISAVQAMYKMDSSKYEIIPIYITKDREWYTGEILKEMETYKDLNLLKRYTKNVVLTTKDNTFILQNKKGFRGIVKELDLVFPIVHGTNVEDGALQGYLRTIGIPFVGSDVTASAIAQDKVFQRLIWEKEDIPMPKLVWFYDTDYITDKESVVKKVGKLNYPLIVKPATLGSSIGIGTAKNEEELIEKIDEAIRYDKKIVVEEMIPNLTEVNISVLGNSTNASVSELERVLTDNDLLTFEDKYISGGKKSGLKGGTYSKGMAMADRIIPADISDKLKEEIKDYALKAFRTLGMSGVARIDFLVDSKKDKVYINEVNACPGSLSFYLWDKVGKDYPELLDEMINIAVKDYKVRTSKIHSFDSNILQNFNGVKGSKGKFGMKGGR